MEAVLMGTRAIFEFFLFRRIVQVTRDFRKARLKNFRALAVAIVQAVARRGPTVAIVEAVARRGPMVAIAPALRDGD